MNARTLVTEEDLKQMIELRREIHRHPELGFDLPKTEALVKRELQAVGIETTDRYAPCSVVGYVGPADAPVTIGIRADMDALPVTEKTGLPYASEEPGKMHACGHDNHVAMLLTVAKVLKRMEKDLKVRVKLIFQPSEECEVSGAELMLNRGVTDDTEELLCTHVDNALESGTLGVCPGDYMTACDPITITFHGRTSHITRPEGGIDALQMAVEAYSRMKAEAEKICAGKPHIFGIGSLKAGEVHNVVPDTAVMKVSFRYYDYDMRELVRSACMDVCCEIAAKIGGTVDFTWEMSAPALHNDVAMAERFRKAADTVLPGKLVTLPYRLSTEDFAWMTRKKPGMIFRLGTGNKALGCTAQAHCNDFKVDEDALKNGVYAFLQYVLDRI